MRKRSLLITPGWDQLWKTISVAALCCLNGVLQCHPVAALQTHTGFPKGNRAAANFDLIYRKRQLISASRSSSNIEDEPSAAVAFSWNKNQPFLCTHWHMVAYPCTKISSGQQAMKRNGSRAESSTAYGSWWLFSRLWLMIVFLEMPNEKNVRDKHLKSHTLC